VNADPVLLSAEEKADLIRRIREGIQGLSRQAKSDFVDAAHSTAAARHVAERALIDAKDAADWNNEFVAANFPEANSVIEEMLESGQPRGLPHVARKAVVDALHAVLCVEVALTRGSNVAPTLAGPVEVVLGILPGIR
jgi:hypothetical protein